MTPQLPPLLDERNLPAAVLHAAVLDGELYPLGERFRPVDLPQDPIARAGGLSRLAEHARVLADRTAAWIWGAASVLALPGSAIVPSAAAVGHPTGLEDPLIRVRTAHLLAADVVRLDGVPVTSPIRTAIDLLCAPEADRDEEAVLRLIECAGVDLRDLETELRSRRRLVGSRRGLARLQVLVTRYTS